MEAHEDLIKQGWLPPKATSIVMKLLNDLVAIRQNTGILMSNQGQAMDGFALLANYNSLADNIINIKSPVIKQYIIVRRKDETPEARLENTVANAVGKLRME